MNVQVGTEVSCPRCDKVMVRCVRVPKQGSLMWADCFENVDWHGKEGDLARCDCGCAFFLAGVGVFVKGLGYTW